MFNDRPINVDIATTILRLGFGGVILAHGLIKYFVFTPAGTAGFFESLGLPGFLGHVVMYGEIAAGVALIAGVAVRAASVALIPIMIGATWAHAGAGFLFSNPNGGWEFPALLIVIAAVQAMLGAGAYRVTDLLGDARGRVAA